jgi:predicted ATPase
MGVRNYLIEGVSCSGKTAVCRELQRRGYQAFNGDTEGGDRAQMACAEVDLTYHPKQVKALYDEVGPCTR